MSFLPGINGCICFKMDNNCKPYFVVLKKYSHVPLAGALAKDAETEPWDADTIDRKAS